MAKCQVLILMKIPGMPPVAVPASHERVDLCFEILVKEDITWFCFPNQKCPKFMARSDEIAGMILQEESGIMLPQNNMKLRS